MSKIILARLFAWNEVLIFFFPLSLQSQRNDAMKKIISPFETFPGAQHFKYHKYPPLPLFPRFPRPSLLTYFPSPLLESTPSSQYSQHTSLDGASSFFLFFSTLPLSRFHPNQRHPRNHQDIKRLSSLLRRITVINPLNGIHTRPLTSHVH